MRSLHSLPESLLWPIKALAAGTSQPRRACTHAPSETASLSVRTSPGHAQDMMQACRSIGLWHRSLRPVAPHPCLRLSLQFWTHTHHPEIVPCTQRTLLH